MGITQDFCVLFYSTEADLDQSNEASDKNKENLLSIATRGDGRKALHLALDEQAYESGKTKVKNFLSNYKSKPYGDDKFVEGTQV